MKTKNTIINLKGSKCPIFPNIVMIDYIEPNNNLIKLIINAIQKC